MSEPKTDREHLEAIVATTSRGMMTSATSGAILAAERFLDLNPSPPTPPAEQCKHQHVTHSGSWKQSEDVTVCSDCGMIDPDPPPEGGAEGRYKPGDSLSGIWQEGVGEGTISSLSNREAAIANAAHAAGASTRGSGELADVLYELAEDERQRANADHSPEGQAAHTRAAELLDDLAAQNPSRGSDGLRELGRKNPVVLCRGNQYRPMMWDTPKKGDLILMPGGVVEVQRDDPRAPMAILHRPAPTNPTERTADNG